MAHTYPDLELPEDDEFRGQALKDSAILPIVVMSEGRRVPTGREADGSAVRTTIKHTSQACWRSAGDLLHSVQRAERELRHATAAPCRAAAQLELSASVCANRWGSYGGSGCSRGPAEGTRRWWGICADRQPIGDCPHGSIA